MTCGAQDGGLLCAAKRGSGMGLLASELSALQATIVIDRSYATARV